MRTLAKIAALLGLTVVGCGARTELTLGEWPFDSGVTDSDVAFDEGVDTALPDAPPPVMQLTASKYATFLLADGVVHAWGANLYGELGTGDREGRNAPTPSPKLIDVREVAPGEGVTCVRDAAWMVRCVGLNEIGELGIGSTSKTPATDPVSPIGRVQRLYVRGHARISIVRRLDGSFAGWGYDNGELGIGSHADAAAVPSPVPIPGLAGATDIALGNYFSCALRPEGTVTCTGSNQAGQLGDGTTTPRMEHALVKGLTSVAKIWTGFAHVCALRTDRSLWCWGYNKRGQIGNGVTATTVVEPAKLTLDGPIAQISAGADHTCALRSGEVLCWGGNTEGQLGDGTTIDRPNAERVRALPPVIEIAVGWEHSCARTSENEVWCWGGSRFGQVGDGTTNTHLTPVKVWPK